MRFVLNWNTVSLSIALVFSNAPISVAADDSYTFNQLGQDLDGEARSDRSGSSIALSNNGKTVAIGATDNDANDRSSGHARVYKFDNSSWLKMGQDLDGEFRYDEAGYDVDLSSDGLIVAVSATGNDDGAWSGGEVRVFQYIGTMWHQMGDDINGQRAYERFGRSLALSGDGMVLAGASRYFASVHQYNGSAWNLLGQQISIDGYGYGSRNSFLSLSSDGSVLAIGDAFLNLVRVFEYEDGIGWSQMGGNITGIGNFGSSVSLAGDDGRTLAVGAPYDDPDINATGMDFGPGPVPRRRLQGFGPGPGPSGGRGSVSVFEYNGSAWDALGSKLYGKHESELFGSAVEISSHGDRIVIGAFLSCGYAGRVALYQYDDAGSWVQRGEDIYGEAFFDESGVAVALSGDGEILASGAEYNYGINGTGSGHVRVYESVTATPTPAPPVALKDYTFDQVGQDIDGEAYFDLSGNSVALADNAKIVAIGASNNRNNKTGYSGHARVYMLEESTWVQIGQDLDGEYRYDSSGYDVALSSSGQIVAVGAIDHDRVGHVRVYQYNGNTWDQMGGDLDGTYRYGRFGMSLALSSSGLIVASAGTRYAMVHEYNGTAWNILGEEISLHYSRSDSKLSLSSDGSVLAVGEDSEEDLSQVQVFQYENATGWISMGPNITSTGYRFGAAVSLSSEGTTIAIGNPRMPNGHGSVSVFQYNGSSWNPLGSPIHGDQIEDYFGEDLDLSSDGQTIVIGAPGNHYNCSTFTGKVSLYKYDGSGAWFKVGDDIAGESIFDHSGSSVAISGDGKLFASGAIFNHGINGTASGHVRVYEPRRLTPPGASGDPHFKTWNGESYDFHGLCDLVLLKNHDFNNGLGMDIHIRTKKMKQWSFISSAVLRIGDDVLEIRGDPHGKTVSYWVNGIEGNEIDLTNNGVLPHSISGYPIFYTQTNSKQHEFTADLGDDGKIVMKTWKELVRVDIHGASEMSFGKSLGLMGSFREGLHVGRDGVTVLADFNDFGQEWQVLPSEPMLFHNREGPQAPAKCSFPTSTKLRRRLRENSVSQEQAAIACAGVDDKTDRNMCIFDVMATNDMEVMGAY